jgi:hypothetical protein
MKRQTVQLSDSLQRKLNAYALAASAAGVGMLALAQPAEARIVYTPAHEEIGPNQTVALDLTHDGDADFILWEFSFCNTDFCRSQLLVRPIGEGLGAEGRYERSSGWGWAYALNKGSRIGRGHPFSAKYMVAAFGSSTCNIGGFWCDVKNRYLGLRFKSHGKTHYGWARLSVKATSFITATLTGYAYETVPNKPIIAGKTHGKDDIAVQPASLGALAAGSSALSTWRHDQGASK